MKMIEYMKNLYSTANGHFSNQSELLGDISQWCMDAIARGEMNCIDGESIGIKSTEKKTILLEDLMGESFLDVDMKKLYGIYIPRDELLRRPKYQWYSILPVNDVLNANVILSKFFKSSMIDSFSEYEKNLGEVKSVIAI
jgi:hypothetical protein